MYKERPEITLIIRQYQQELKKMGVTAERIILFGSYSRGKEQEGSDIDLLIISDDFAGMNLRQRSEALGIAAVRIMQPIEAIGSTPEEIDSVSPANFLTEVIASGVAVA